MSDKLQDSYSRGYMANLSRSARLFKPAHINQEVYRRLRQVSLLMEGISEKCEVFNKYHINPYECDATTKYLLEINGEVKDLCKALTRDNISHYQTLLMLLYNVEHLTKTVCSPIDRLRLVCLERSKKKDELQTEIKELVKDMADTVRLISAEVAKLRETPIIFITPSSSQILH